MFHIGWSTGDDGFIHTFIEGGREGAREMQALTPPEGVRGRTLFYQYTDYLKLGLYRCVEGGRQKGREGGRVELAYSYFKIGQGDTFTPLSNPNLY